MKKFKVGIVGADGLNPAWTPGREEKAKSIINQILDFPKNRNGTVGHVYKWMKITSEKNPLGFASWFDCKPLQERGMEIVLVSGHCQVGEDRPYCVTCGGWLSKRPFPSDTLSSYEYHRDEGHIIIEVYDKGGIDTFAEIIATQLGIQKEIYPAEVNQWEDLISPFCLRTETKLIGYRSRNIQIAKSINVIYDVEPKGSCKYCGGTGVNETSKLPTDMTRLARQSGEKHVFLKCYYCKGTGNYSGGTWTLQYAQKLGKEVHQIIID